MSPSIALLWSERQVRGIGADISDVEISVGATVVTTTTSSHRRDGAPVPAPSVAAPGPPSPVSAARSPVSVSTAGPPVAIS